MALDTFFWSWKGIKTNWWIRTYNPSVSLALSESKDTLHFPSERHWLNFAWDLTFTWLKDLWTSTNLQFWLTCFIGLWNKEIHCCIDMHSHVCQCNICKQESWMFGTLWKYCAAHLSVISISVENLVLGFQFLLESLPSLVWGWLNVFWVMIWTQTHCFPGQRREQNSRKLD